MASLAHTLKRVDWIVPNIRKTIKHLEKIEANLQSQDVCLYTVEHHIEKAAEHLKIADNHFTAWWIYDSTFGEIK